MSYLLKNHNLSTKLILLALSSGLALAGCGIFGSSTKSHNRARLPKVPPKEIPGGAGDNWRYLGTSSNKLITIEINESSLIKSVGNAQGNVSKFQDRKTIIDPAQFSYQGLSPSYKYSLSWWLMDCDYKRYNITSTSIYDINGKLIKTYNFDNSSSTDLESKWTTIDNGSLAELQYKYACLGINRNIGY